MGKHLQLTHEIQQHEPTIQNQQQREQIIAHYFFNYPHGQANKQTILRPILKIMRNQPEILDLSTLATNTQNTVAQMMLQYPETTQHEPILQENKQWCIKCHENFRTKRGLTHHRNFSKQCYVPKEAKTQHNIPILCTNDDCDQILQTKLKRHCSTTAINTTRSRK